MGGQNQAHGSTLTTEIKTSLPQLRRKLHTNRGYGIGGTAKNTTQSSITEEMRAELAFRKDLRNYKNRESKIKSKIEEPRHQT
jgi:hypothetical protein